jgi:hypothetical protein
MGRPKLPEGKALSRREINQRYRDNPSNKAKIQTYETQVRAPRMMLARLQNKISEKVKIMWKKRKPNDASKKSTDAGEEEEEEVNLEEEANQEEEPNPEEESNQEEVDEDYGEKSLESKKSYGLGGVKKTIKKVKLRSGKSNQSIVGEKIRRRNQKDKNELLEILQKQLMESEKEKCEAMVKAKIAEQKLANKSAEVEDMKEKRKSDNSWLKDVYRSLTSESKRDFKCSVQFNKKGFVPGTLGRLRDCTGVNFSQIPTPTNPALSALAKKVEEFSILNSSEIPDMKANKSVFSSSNAPNKRFANHHLTVLHSQFDIDHPDLTVSYSQFCHYWPSYIIKPKASDFTSCHCQICDNAGSKFTCLLKEELIDQSRGL